MRGPTLLLTLCLALPAAAQTAEVQRLLEVATTLHEAEEDEKALKQLARARARASGTEDELAIALLEGVVLATLGREDKALQAFRTAFGIDLEAPLPFEVPPAVQQLAEKARATVRRLLAPAVELRKSEALRRAAEERQRLEELARGQAEELRLEALDQARLGRSPPVVVTVPPPPLPPAPGRSVRSLSWIPGAAGLVAGGLGTTFLLGARAKYVALIDRTVNPSVAGSYRASGPTDAAIGTALLGVGAAGVVTAALMFALGGAQGPVAFVPVPQGGVLTAALQF